MADYREALLARFANPRMRDQLARIAADGSVKLPVRILPTVRAERAAGRVPVGGATTLAAWVLHLRGLGAPVKDPGAGPAQEAAGSGELAVAVPAVLDVLEPGLGSDTALVDAVLAQAQALQAKPQADPTAMSGPAEVIIGVDVGTTAVKVAAFHCTADRGGCPPRCGSTRCSSRSRVGRSRTR